MVNVVVLVKDERVRLQVEKLFEELNFPDLRGAFFGSLEEFESLYLRDKEAEAAAAAAAEATDGSEGAELRLFSEINLFLYALDSIGERSNTQWIEHLRRHLKPLGFWPESGLRLVCLKYEDDNVPKLDLVHPALDDLIYLPLDRLVFLQKLQILLSLPKRAAPTFLFNQPFNMNIEISKITKLDKLSDVALAIRNPVPLRRGVAGHFYVVLPTDREPLELKGKVLRSEPHPDHPGQFMVYFSFFGLTKAAMSQIRRALTKDTHYKSLQADDQARFAFRADDLFLSDEERHRFGVVVIDRDQGDAMQLADHLRKDMDRLEIEIEASYSLFLHRYLDHEAAAQNQTPARASVRTDFFGSPCLITVGVGDQRVVSVSPTPKDEDLLLGFKAPDLLTDPSVWPRLIADKGTRLVLDEAAHLTGVGKPFERVIVLTDAGGQRALVGLTLTKGAIDQTVTLQLRPTTAAEAEHHHKGHHRRDNLGALIVEAGIVPPDPAAWVEGLTTRAKETGVTPAGRELKFWIINDRDEVPETWLNAPAIVGALRRPVDHRELLFSLAENLPNANTVYHFANLGWSHPGLNLHVSKPIALEALSEFGATLRSEHPLAPGSVFYLRKSIFDNAPNRCLAARVYACEEHPTVEGHYLVFVLYWGINDAFLKFARTWIRDQYASQKQEG